ncbi:DUF4166 domain-containing protein [Nocardioides jensenii]|uniref:DUF4166 domain-containing protein n=1 Tax=Nocardioides jensenii TaxID=1843 RepID=UPI00083602A3|nr:DUF4166 domain-containing protein [Nocardioides jensenii]
MTSIFQHALGDRFHDLHPQLQRRFGFSSADGVACVGRGTMDTVWRGGPHTVPFLRLGTSRNILFPETGVDVPFVIENYAYVDGFGRETVTFVRTFDVAPGRRRRFDATMVHSESRGRVVDYLGTHQHVAVDLDLGVDDRGGLTIRSGAQRFHTALAGIALPQGLSGVAEVHERYDEERERFLISVNVRSPWAGPIFGYTGSFTAHFVETRDVPAAVKPFREVARD